jgi:hypothetical protein
MIEDAVKRIYPVMLLMGFTLAIMPLVECEKVEYEKVKCENGADKRAGVEYRLPGDNHRGFNPNQTRVFAGNFGVNSP